MVFLGIVTSATAITLHEFLNSTVGCGDTIDTCPGCDLGGCTLNGIDTDQDIEAESINNLTITNSKLRAFGVTNSTLVAFDNVLSVGGVRVTDTQTFTSTDSSFVGSDGDPNGRCRPGVFVGNLESVILEGFFKGGDDFVTGQSGCHGIHAVDVLNLEVTRGDSYGGDGDINGGDGVRHNNEVNQTLGLVCNNYGGYGINNLNGSGVFASIENANGTQIADIRGNSMGYIGIYLSILSGDQSVTIVGDTYGEIDGIFVQINDLYEVNQDVTVTGDTQGGIKVQGRFGFQNVAITGNTQDGPQADDFGILVILHEGDQSVTVNGNTQGSTAISVELNTGNQAVTVIGDSSGEFGTLNYGIRSLIASPDNNNTQILTVTGNTQGTTAIFVSNPVGFQNVTITGNSFGGSQQTPGDVGIRIRTPGPSGDFDPIVQFVTIIGHTYGYYGIDVSGEAKFQTVYVEGNTVGLGPNGIGVNGVNGAQTLTIRGNVYSVGIAIFTTATGSNQTIDLIGNAEGATAIECQVGDEITETSYQTIIVVGNLVGLSEKGHGINAIMISDGDQTINVQGNVVGTQVGILAAMVTGTQIIDLIGNSQSKGTPAKNVHGTISGRMDGGDQYITVVGVIQSIDQALEAIVVTNGTQNIAVTGDSQGLIVISMRNGIQNVNVQGDTQGAIRSTLIGDGSQNVTVVGNTQGGGIDNAISVSSVSGVQLVFVTGNTYGYGGVNVLMSSGLIDSIQTVIVDGDVQAFGLNGVFVQLSGFGNQTLNHVGNVQAFGTGVGAQIDSGSQDVSVVGNVQAALGILCLVDQNATQSLNVEGDVIVVGTYGIRVSSTFEDQSVNIVGNIWGPIHGISIQSASGLQVVGINGNVQGQQPIFIKLLDEGNQTVNMTGGVQALDSDDWNLNAAVDIRADFGFQSVTVNGQVQGGKLEYGVRYGIYIVLGSGDQNVVIEADTMGKNSGIYVDMTENGTQTVNIAGTTQIYDIMSGRFAIVVTSFWPNSVTDQTVTINGQSVGGISISHLSGNQIILITGETSGYHGIAVSVQDSDLQTVTIRGNTHAVNQGISIDGDAIIQIVDVEGNIHGRLGVFGGFNQTVTIVGNTQSPDGGDGVTIQGQLGVQFVNMTGNSQGGISVNLYPGFNETESSIQTVIINGNIQAPTGNAIDLSVAGIGNQTLILVGNFESTGVFVQLLSGSQTVSVIGNIQSTTGMLCLVQENATQSLTVQGNVQGLIAGIVEEGEQIVAITGTIQGSVILIAFGDQDLSIDGDVHGSDDIIVASQFINETFGIDLPPNSGVYAYASGIQNIDINGTTHGGQNGNGLTVYAGTFSRIAFIRNYGDGFGSGLELTSFENTTESVTVVGQNFGYIGARVHNIANVELETQNRGETYGLDLSSTRNVTVHGYNFGREYAIRAITTRDDLIIEANVTGITDAILVQDCDKLQLRSQVRGSVDISTCDRVLVSDTIRGPVRIVDPEYVDFTALNEDGGVTIENPQISVFVNATIDSDETALTITNSDAKIEVRGSITGADGVDIENSTGAAVVDAEITGRNGYGFRMISGLINLMSRLVFGQTEAIHLERTQATMTTEARGGNGRERDGGNALFAFNSTVEIVGGYYYGGKGDVGFNGGDGAIITDSQLTTSNVTISGGDGGVGRNGPTNGGVGMTITGSEGTPIEGNFFGGEGGRYQAPVAFPCNQPVYGVGGAAIYTELDGSMEFSGYAGRGQHADYDGVFSGSGNMTFSSFTADAILIVNATFGTLSVVNSSISRIFGDNNSMIESVEFDSSRGHNATFMASNVGFFNYTGSDFCTVDLRGNVATLAESPPQSNMNIITDDGVTDEGTDPEWCPYCGFVAVDPPENCTACYDQLQTCNSSLQNATDLLDECSAGLGNCIDTLNSTQGALDNCTDGLGDCNDSLNTTQGALDSCTDTLNTTQGQLNNCTDGLGDCGDALSAAQGALDDCTDTLNSTQGNLQNCTNTLNTTQGALGNCTDNLDECNADLQNSTTSLGNCTQNLNNCTASLANCTDIITDCPRDLANCTTSFNNCTENLDECGFTLQGLFDSYQTCTDSLGNCTVALANCTRGQNPDCHQDYPEACHEPPTYEYGRHFERSPESSCYSESSDESFECKPTELCVSKCEAERLIRQRSRAFSYGLKRCQMKCDQYCVHCSTGFTYDARGHVKC